MRPTTRHDADPRRTRGEGRRVSHRLRRVGVPVLVAIAAACAHGALASDPAFPPYVPAQAAAAQPVIHTEHRGNAGRLGPTLVRTCEQMCQPPLRAKRCTVEGDPQRHGDFVAHVYRSADAAVRYTRTWALVQQGGDLCTLRLELKQSVRLALFDGRNTALHDADLDRGTGTRRTVAGRSPELVLDTAKGMAALRADGYVRAGTSRVAGYACELWRKRAADLEFETCLLADPALPPRVGTIELHGAPLSSSTRGRDPDGGNWSAVQSLRIDVNVPAELFQPPAGIRWKDTR